MRGSPRRSAPTTPPACYPDEPTWVPILPKTSYKDKTRMSRTQFPIVAGFALTVNKAQGLTSKEGVVIHLVGGPKFRPASKHGLPFVAWTRSESFAMTAFKNLPAWHDFQRGRDSDMLQNRYWFTHGERYFKYSPTVRCDLDSLHRRTMAKYSQMKTEEQENEAWRLWHRNREGRSKRQKQEEVRMPCPACACGGG